MEQRIGIIGAGNIGQTIARLLLKGGHQVFLSNSKGPDSLADLINELGNAATAVTAAEAAKQKIVVLALPWTSLSSLSRLTDWTGKIVIDATNHFVRQTPPLQLADLGSKSSGEVTLDCLPGALVVKAFNTLYFELLLLDPNYGEGKRVLFISGDNVGAKNVVMELIESAGFSPIDLGTLNDGCKLHQAGGLLAGKNLILLH